MKIEPLKPFDVNQNAFNEEGFLNPMRHDIENMGTRLGKNVMILHKNFDSELCPWMIVVDNKTGERLKISFE